MSESNQLQTFPVPIRSPFERGNLNIDPGAIKGLLSWEWVMERVKAAHNYWLGSTYPDGRPHAIPIWCVWHNGTFYFIPKWSFTWKAARK